MYEDYIYISNINEFTSSTTCVEIGLKGGNITRLQVNDIDMIWQNKSQMWPRKEKIIKGTGNQPAPILFPIAGPLKSLASYDTSSLEQVDIDGKKGFIIDGNFYSADTKGYFYEGKFYAMNQHGFVRDSMFEVVDYYNDGCLLRLNSNDETKKQYPFDFQLDVLYKVVTGGVNINYIVKNTGDKIMPFNIGDHPGFQLENSVDNYYLQFEDNDNTYASYNNERSYVDDNNKLYLTNKMFENRQAVRLFNVSSDKVTLCKKGKGNVKDKIVSIYDVQADNLLLWSADTSGLLCIEPWYANDHLFDDINKNIASGDIKTLMPNEEFSYSRRMRFPDEHYISKLKAIEKAKAKIKSIHNS